jgi:Skp family chaperone for outer membrane proteins
MRPLARAAAAALAFSLPAAAVPVRFAAAQAAAPRIGYVDVAQVLEQVPGRAEAQQAFEREATGIRAELQRMQDSLQTLVTGYQRVQGTLTPAQRQTRERDVQTQSRGSSSAPRRCRSAAAGASRSSRPSSRASCGRRSTTCAPRAGTR